MSYASWNQYTTYVIGDTVIYNGLIYNALINNKNIIPSSSPTVWHYESNVGPAGADSYGVWNSGNSSNSGEWNIISFDLQLSTTSANNGGSIWIENLKNLCAVPAYYQKIVLTAYQDSGVSVSWLVIGEPYNDGDFWIIGVDPITPTPIWALGQPTYFNFAITGPTGVATDAGLLNKLGIVPTSSSMVVSTVNYSDVGTPSDWVPDQNPPISGGVNNGWRFVKTAGAGGGTSKINWYCYNPYYGLTPPLSPASPVILKRNLNALWAVITPSVSINIQGVIYFSIYTYDTASPPVGFYTNRWDYSANNLALPLTTGALTLQAGFKYLIYCYDAPKIVASPVSTTTITNCNGQYPSQLSTNLMKDPYDIHTDIPHIGFSAVSLTNVSISDPTTIQVSAIAIQTTSSTVANGLDFTIHSIGYRANGGLQTVEYNLEFS